jgi:hypothetical protein
MVLETLKLKLADVNEWRLEAIKELPTEFRDRHKDNHAVLLCGFRLLDRALRTAGFPLTLVADVERVRQGMIKFWFDNLGDYVARQSETEILRLFKHFAKLAGSVDCNGSRRLMPQIHFVMTEQVLYLNLEAAYTELEILFSRLSSKILEYENTGQIRQLLTDEDFFIGFGPVPGHPDALNWLAVDRKRLEAKGVMMEAFRG